MSLAVRPSPIRIAGCLSTILVLLLVAASSAAAAGGSLAGTPAPTVAPGFCQGGWAGVGLTNNSSGFNNVTGSPEYGPVPVSVGFSVFAGNMSGPVNFTLRFGDGNETNGTITMLYGQGATQVSHRFTVAAVYQVVVNWTSGCGSQGSSASQPIELFGSGGPNPISVAANTSSGLVPLPVTYQATVAGAPAGAIFEWDVFTPTGNGGVTNTTTPWLNYTWDSPVDSSGWYAGLLTVAYPSGLTYAVGAIPGVTVLPLVDIAVTNSTIANAASGSFTLTAYVNDSPYDPAGTNQSYIGPGTVVWSFASFSGYPFSSVNISGPTTGTTVNETFQIGNWGQCGGCFISSYYTVSFVDPNSTTLGITQQDLLFRSGGNPPPPPPVLSISASPSNGSSPLTTTITVDSTQWGAANISSYHLNLTLCVSAPNGSAPGCPTLSSSVDPLDGPVATFSLNLSTPGSYWVNASLVYVGSGPNGTTYFVEGTASTVVYVFGAGPGGPSPLGLSISAAPSSGYAPLNVSLAVQASGGDAPYNLSICANPATGGSGCLLSAGSTGWTGASTTIPLTFASAGNYTVDVGLVDSAGSNTSQSVSITVESAPRAAPLLVQVSGQSVAGAPGLVDFQATISGGVSPYQIQWAFGDGAVGSSVPGETTRHTYTSAGEFFPTLTVTDAVGTVRTTELAPVLIPTLHGGSSAPLISSSVGVLVGSGIAVVLALAALITAARHGAERRRIRAWARSVTPPAEESTGPKYP